jgi:hypothetical protein
MTTQKHNKPAARKAPAIPKRIRDLQELIEAGFQLAGREVIEVETWARARMTIANRQIVARIMLSLAGTRPQKGGAA